MLYVKGLLMFCFLLLGFVESLMMGFQGLFDFSLF